MNRIYRIVFNRTRGVAQVVSELACTASVPMASAPRLRGHPRRPLAAALGLAVAAAASPAWAAVCTQTSGIVTMSCTGTAGAAGAAGSSPGNPGGAGGAGVTATGSLVINAGTTIKGGAGGTGAAGSSVALAGAGGQGGAGAIIGISNAAVTSAGTLTGGAGGAGGLVGASTTVRGAAGSGGVGVLISGSGNTFVSTGNINGGLDGTLANRALAVSITGSNNTLELDNGFAFTGNVMAIAAHGNVLALGGTGNNSFDASGLGAVYNGFDRYLKSGAGIWVLTGTSTSVTPWTVNTGTLAITSDASLGVGSTTLSLNGGTLETKANGMTVSRPISVTTLTSGIQVDAFQTSTLSGTVSGTGALTKLGQGTLNITGTNTYTGGTIVANGVLNFTSAANLGTGDLTLSGGILYAMGGATINGAVLLVGTDSRYRVDPGFVNALTGVVSGTGALTKTGAGTLLFGNANTFSGGVSVTAGTLQVANAYGLGSGLLTLAGGTLATTAAISLSQGVVLGGGGGTINIAAGVTDSFGAAVTGTGALTVAGAGSLSLAAPSTYAGATTINGATLALAGSGSVALTSGIANNGTFDISGATGDTFVNTIAGTGGIVLGANTLVVGSAAGTLGGVISGSGGLTVLSGSETLTANNTYTGTTTIASGSLQLGTGGATGAIAGDVVDNGVLAINRSGATTLAGTLSGSGQLAINGTGTVTLSGANTLTGATRINAGTLALAGSGSLSASSLTNDGQLDISSIGAGSSTVTGLSGSGTVLLGNKQLVISESGANTFAGTFTGSGGVQKTGTGTTTLSGDNTYTGLTNIAAGTLVLNGGSVAASGGVVDNGRLVLAAGTPVSLSTLSGSGDVELGSGSLTLTAAAGTFSGVIAGGGSFGIDAGKTILAGANTYAGGTTIAAGATLQLGDGGETGSIIGPVVNNGTLAFNRADDTTFAGLVSGRGGLVKDNADVLTLTAANTYTGATIINGGSIAFAGEGSIAGSSGVVVNTSVDISATNDGLAIPTLAGSGTVLLGSKTLTLTAAHDDFNGVITGPGNFTIETGTERLGGSNSYSGVTTIAGGTLSLFGLGSVASSRVLDNGTFDLTGATDDVAVRGLAGTGGVVLGAHSMSLTNADGTFAGVISGAGGFTVGAGGTEVLAGANTYSGTTTIAGTLALTGNGAVAASARLVDNGVFDISGTTHGALLRSLSGAGEILLGQQMLTLTGAGDEFAGVLSGSGGLALQAGRETLAGINTYTGGTAIVAGSTLALARDGSIANSSGVAVNGALDIGASNNPVSIYTLAGTGNVLLGSQTLRLTAASDAFSGVITGTGGLDVAGGALRLQGASSYSGSTTVATGAMLTLAGEGAISRSRVVDNGTFDISATERGATIASLDGAGEVVLGAKVLTINRATDTFDGTLTGTGGLVLADGSQTLAGNNTYTGGTTVLGGTLTLGNGGYSGSIAGDVADNGSVAFDRNDAVCFAGVISGAGRVIKLGAGTLDMEGTNTYSGGTLLTSGSLLIGRASSVGSGVLAMAEGTSIRFARSFTLANAITLSGDPIVDVATGVTTELAGTIVDGTDAGDLVKTGAGTLVVSGSDTYSGNTEVAAGIFEIRGTISSVITVDDSATLTGAGTVGGLTVAGGGTVSPAGGSVGTLSVDGNLILARGSHYQIDATDAGGVDLIRASGGASLGGSAVALVAGTNWTRGRTYTIVQADRGLTGHFDAVSANFAYLTPTLSYDTNHAYLTLLRNTTAFDAEANTPNQHAVARAVEALGFGQPVYDAVVALDGPGARAAYNALDGVLLPSTGTAIIDDGRYLRQAVGNHLLGVDDRVGADAQGSVWTSTWGHWGAHDGGLDAPRQTANGSGLLVGADRDLGRWKLGAAVGRGQLSDGMANGDSSHGTSTQAGIYTAVDLDAWQVHAGAAYSRYSLRTHRSIALDGLPDNVGASVDSALTQTWLDGGYRIDLGAGNLTPFANVARVWLHTDAIRESGSAAALDVAASGRQVNEGTVGLRAAFNAGASTQVHASLGLRHAWGDLQGADRQRFADGDGTTTFTVDGAQAARNAAVLATGVKFAVRPNISVDATYDGSFANHARQQEARLSMNLTF